MFEGSLRQTAAGTPAPERVFLIQNHALFREGLKRILEGTYTVCGEAGSAREVWECLARVKPDVVLLDVCQAGVDGLELIKSLTTRYADLCVVALSAHAEELYAERALRAGARGYITKNASADDLLRAIRTVLTGNIYLSPALSSQLLRGFMNYKRPGTYGVEQLSDRELEIFRLLGDGYTTREIASSLHISVKTVESHRGNIREKLNLASGAELLRAAMALNHMAAQSVP